MGWVRVSIKVELDKPGPIELRWAIKVETRGFRTVLTPLSHGYIAARSRHH